MLNVALIGLLAGSLALTPPDGTGDDKKTPNGDKPAATEATPGVFETAAASEIASPETIIQDSYAYGRSAAETPFKFWVEYGYGRTSDEYHLADGTDGAYPAGTITTQRYSAGAQIDFLSLPLFKLGVGADVTMAKNSPENASATYTPAGAPAAVTFNYTSSDLGLQGLKLYAQAQGRVAGLHGGYIFDFGDATTYVGATQVGAAILSGNPIDVQLGESDDRNALNFGADFDYPSERFRLFGGVDYFHIGRINTEPLAAGQTQPEDDDIYNFVVGAGLKFAIAELGAALQIQTRAGAPTNTQFGTSGIGGHVRTVTPYLRLSPPSLPASLFIKGAVQDEYTEYGLDLGGANGPKSKIGFTAGLTFGFN